MPSRLASLSLRGLIAVIIFSTLVLFECDSGDSALEKIVLERKAHFSLLQSAAGKETEEHGSEEDLEVGIETRVRRQFVDKICGAICTYACCVDHSHSLFVNSIICDIM